MNADIKVEEFKEDEGAHSNPKNLIVEDDEEEVLGRARQNTFVP